MRQLSTRDEFLDLLDQAIFEADELCVSVGFDEIEEFEPFAPVYEQLAYRLRALHAKILAGEHQFADGSDLEFMTLVQKYRRAIPIHDLLESLNRAHRNGVQDRSE